MLIQKHKRKEHNVTQMKQQKNIAAINKEKQKEEKKKEG